MYGSKRLDGHLTKKGGVQWRRRWFILEDHVITYFTRQGDLRPRGRMVLIPESRVADLPSRAHAFQVFTKEKALMVFAGTMEDRERWVAAVNKEIQGLKERALKRQSGRSVRAEKAAGTVFELDMKYEMIKPMGHGSSGVVISALNNESNSKVAIKKIPGAFDELVDAKRIVSEIRLLRHFNHDNIIKLVDILPPSSLEDFDDVYMVCELMETDLHRVIYSRQQLTNEHAQFFLHQILCALKYIHSASVLHRDLKPSNVLLNANCDLKLCDFGLSRGLQDEHESEDFTEYVVTRWYRAPEIMLSVRNYDEAIDVWSVGCILGEMLDRKPLYAGGDYLQQLKLISALLGKPTKSDIRFVSNPRARQFMLELPETSPVDLGGKFPDADPDAVDLLSKMLVLDPRRRISVEQALEHPYLASLHDLALETTAESPMDLKFIERAEPTKHNLRLMVLEDVLHFHPECKSLVEPPLDATTVMAVPASAEGGGARAPPNPKGPPTGISISSSTSSRGCVASSSKNAAAAGSLVPTPAAKPSASAAITQELECAIPEDGQECRQQVMQEVEPASRVPIVPSAPESTDAKEAASRDDGGSQEESAWPPKETIGPTFGPRPGWAGNSGDGDVELGEDAVMLASVEVASSGGGSRGGMVKPEISRIEGGADDGSVVPARAAAAAATASAACFPRQNRVGGSLGIVPPSGLAGGASASQRSVMKESDIQQRRHRTEELRNIYQQDIRSFVKRGSSLLKRVHKTRAASQHSEQVLKLARYVKEGHHALLYFSRCYGTGHVPSATGLQSLEHSLIRLHRASSVLQQQQQQQQYPSQQSVASQPSLPDLPPVMSESSSGLFGGSLDMGNLEPVPASNPVDHQASGGGEDFDTHPLPLDGVPLDDHDWPREKNTDTASSLEVAPVPQYRAARGFGDEEGGKHFGNSSQGSGDAKINRLSQENSTSLLDAEEVAENIPEAMEVNKDDMNTSPEEAALSRGLDNELPSPRKTTLAARDAILTTSLGPGPATYVSRAHAVELELQAGSLDDELPLEVTITQGLAFVDCSTEKSGRAPFCDGVATDDEFLAMTFVHGPDGVTFPDEKPAKLRFFLGYVDDLAPTGDGADQVAITDEEIERDILEAYRPLSSPDGAGSWTALGAYSVVFRRLLGQREVWVETPVHHFSVTANAKKVDKGGKNQSFYYGDLGGLRWWFKGRSSAPRVRFGNTTKDNCATFTYYPIVQHTEASSESEIHAEIGAMEGALGGGRRIYSSAVGGALPAAGEHITTIVEAGTYEDCDLSYGVKKHSQMHVRVGVLQDLTGRGLKSRGKLQLLDVRKISGNRILVLREPRLRRPAQYEEIDWPCGAEDICKL